MDDYHGMQIMPQKKCKKFKDGSVGCWVESLRYQALQKGFAYPCNRNICLQKKYARIDPSWTLKKWVRNSDYSDSI